MKSYFYQSPKLMKKWLESQFNMKRRQDQYFRDAFLSAVRLSEERLNLEKADSLRELVLNMTIEEQWKYANNYHLESLYNIFYSLHQASRGKSMIIKGQEAITKDLVDPDKFPIWDLKPAKNLFYSTWETVIGRLRYQFGHQLIVRESLIEHPHGGKGVFAVLPHNSSSIRVGQFLGLVPGAIYDSYSSYEQLKLSELSVYSKIPKHLHFPSGKVLQLSEIKYENEFLIRDESQIFFEPSLKNPYALGHMINHPPPGMRPNVVFSEIQLPENFLPTFLYKKYLPYDSHEPKSVEKIKKISLFGIFASQQIKHGQELYVNYCENHIYPINEIPDWFIEPPCDEKNIQTADGIILGLIKGQYENPQPSYWSWVEKKALERNKKLYEKYRMQINRNPGQVIFENQDIKIRTMKSSINDDI